MNKKKILISILIIVVALGVFLIFDKLYPVILVNWQSVNARSFDEDFNTAVFYYQTAVKVYNQTDAASASSLEVQQEIKGAVLDKLVEDILITNELAKRLSRDDLSQMIKDKIDEILKGQDIAEQVKTIYNLSLEQFRQELLEPQARLEILQARLALENINFDDWLKSAEQQARVIILLPGFAWSGEGVVAK